MRDEGLERLKPRGTALDGRWFSGVFALHGGGRGAEAPENPPRVETEARLERGSSIFPYVPYPEQVKFMTDVSGIVGAAAS